jgi:hypothetical protein
MDKSLANGGILCPNNWIRFIFGDLRSVTRGPAGKPNGGEQLKVRDRLESSFQATGLESSA